MTRYDNENLIADYHLESAFRIYDDATPLRLRRITERVEAGLVIDSADDVGTLTLGKLLDMLGDYVDDSNGERESFLNEISARADIFQFIPITNIVNSFVHSSEPYVELGDLHDAGELAFSLRRFPDYSVMEVHAYDYNSGEQADIRLMFSAEDEGEVMTGIQVSDGIAWQESEHFNLDLASRYDRNYRQWEGRDSNLCIYKDIIDKPELAPVATSGSYSDLEDAPAVKQPMFPMWPNETAFDEVAEAIADGTPLYICIEEDGDVSIMAPCTYRQEDDDHIRLEYMRASEDDALPRFEYIWVSRHDGWGGDGGYDLQEALESGTTIKTINNQSLLGSGNIDIQAGGGGEPNVIESITINGAVIPPDEDKNVTFTVPYDLMFTPSGNFSVEYLAGGWEVELLKPIPTNVSDLVNDAGYQTSSDVSGAITTALANSDNPYMTEAMTEAAVEEALASVDAIKAVKVNGTALVPDASKAVDVPVPILELNQESVEFTPEAGGPAIELATEAQLARSLANFDQSLADLDQSLADLNVRVDQSLADVAAALDQAIRDKPDMKINPGNVRLINGDAEFALSAEALSEGLLTVEWTDGEEPEDVSVYLATREYVDGRDPFMLIDFSVYPNITIPSCTQDIPNTNIPNFDINLDDIDASLKANWAIAGLSKYEAYDSSSSRINCWPVCSFSMNQQSTLRVRMMCAGTTSQTVYRVNGAILLKHR